MDYSWDQRKSILTYYFAFNLFKKNKKMLSEVVLQAQLIQLLSITKAKLFTDERLDSHMPGVYRLQYWLRKWQESLQNNPSPGHKEAYEAATGIYDMVEEIFDRQPSYLGGIIFSNGDIEHFRKITQRSALSDEINSSNVPQLNEIKLQKEMDRMFKSLSAAFSKASKDDYSWERKKEFWATVVAAHFARQKGISKGGAKLEAHTIGFLETHRASEASVEKVAETAEKIHQYMGTIKHFGARNESERKLITKYRNFRPYIDSFLEYHPHLIGYVPCGERKRFFKAILHDESLKQAAKELTEESSKAAKPRHLKLIHSVTDKSEKRSTPTPER